ncbi:MAG TPA: hypothetical protein VFS30_04045 [Dehalococcoidia bacterium]|nr:hypothetical protein [Dehalococcoidia bacterium]
MAKKRSHGIAGAKRISTPRAAEQQETKVDNQQLDLVRRSDERTRFVTSNLRSLQFAQGNAFVQRMLANRNLAEPAIQRDEKKPATSAPVRNPTFEDARNYIGRYFARQRDIHGLLVSARDMAFENFKIYSGDEYNKKSDSGLLQVFELALSLLPLAGPALKAFKSLRYGNSDLVGLIANMDKIQRIDKAVKAVETVKDAKEGIEKGVEPVKKLKDLEVSSEGPGSSPTLQFQLQAISSLMDLSKKEVMNIWNGEDLIYNHLETLKYSNSVNLEQLVKSQLGELPSTATLESLVDGVARFFELGLYKAFYCDEKRARRLYVKESKNAPESYWGLQGMPDGVMNRITNLYGWYLVPVPKEVVILPSETRLKGGMKF